MANITRADKSESNNIVKACRAVIMHFKPKVWFIENPRGALAEQECMQDIGHLKRPCTYCQYGADYKKPTHIWTNVPVSLRNCDDTPCHHYQEYKTHARTAQRGPSSNGAIGTPRKDAYTVPRQLLTML